MSNPALHERITISHEASPDDLNVLRKIVAASARGALDLSEPKSRQVVGMAIRGLVRRRLVDKGF